MTLKSMCKLFLAVGLLVFLANVVAQIPAGVERIEAKAHHGR